MILKNCSLYDSKRRGIRFFLITENVMVKKIPIDCMHEIDLCKSGCQQNTSMHIGSEFDASSMLSLIDQALLVKLKPVNWESATGALRKSRTVKWLITGKGLVSYTCILKLVRCFEKTNLVL